MFGFGQSGHIQRKKRLKIEESRIQDKRKPYWPSIRFKVGKRLNSGESSIDCLHDCPIWFHIYSTIIVPFENNII